MTEQTVQSDETNPTASADLLAQLDAMEGGEIDAEVMMQLYAESLQDLAEGDVVNGRIIQRDPYRNRMLR